MIFHAFLIKYAEIAIKGKNRYLFEDALVKQMKLALEPVEGEFTVTKEQGSADKKVRVKWREKSSK